MIGVNNMTKSEIQALFSRIMPLSGREDSSIVIPIKKLFTTIGGSPYVNVNYVNVGFDWDKGKIFIVPEEPLMKVSDYEGAPNLIKELQEKVGLLQYEARHYRAEMKKLQTKLKENENAKQQND